MKSQTPEERAAALVTAGEHDPRAVWFGDALLSLAQDDASARIAVATVRAELAKAFRESDAAAETRGRIAGLTDAQRPVCRRHDSQPDPRRHQREAGAHVSAPLTDADIAAFERVAQTLTSARLFGHGNVAATAYTDDVPRLVAALRAERAESARMRNALADLVAALPKCGCGRALAMHLRTSGGNRSPLYCDEHAVAEKRVGWKPEPLTYAVPLRAAIAALAPTDPAAKGTQPL